MPIRKTERMLPKITKLCLIWAVILAFISAMLSSIFFENIEKVVPIGDDMLEFYFYDGRMIKQEWHSTARQRGWTEERKRITLEKRLQTMEERKNAKKCKSDTSNS